MSESQVISGPRIMMGKPVIAGTRIMVELIVEKLAAGETIHQILEAHPRLTAKSVRAALALPHPSSGRTSCIHFPLRLGSRLEHPRLRSSPSPAASTQANCTTRLPPSGRVRSGSVGEVRRLGNHSPLGCARRLAFPAALAARWLPSPFPEQSGRYRVGRIV